MNKATLPPSPNWYLSNILCCSLNGTIAWGSRNVIVVAISNADNKSFKYSIIKNAHKDRVTLLTCPPSKYASFNLLASTADDNTIKIWNMDTLSLENSYTLETGKQAVGLDWAFSDVSVVRCATSDGHAISWNFRYNTVSSIYLGKEIMTTLSCCPHNDSLIAIGSKSGLVYIASFYGRGSVLYKLRGHDTEILSLSWCPSDRNVISKTDKKDLLLASAGRDRSIYVWRAGGDGRYETKVALPAVPLDSHKHRSKLNASTGNFVTISWVQPRLLLASSSWGELISWNCSTIAKRKSVWRLIHAHHARGLFCIANVKDVSEDTMGDWREESSITVWTTAQGRRVVGCSIKENNVEVLYNISTQGGYVYCMAACPVDTTRIAFGVGDAMLRLWNLSEAHDVSFDVTALWQKIKGKIRAVSWHPQKENLLAYATGEGRIGVFDTNNINKPPILYRQYHRSTVYALGWGPSGQSEHYVLYSCGEGELVSYDSKLVTEAKPTVLVKEECTEFSWKPDFSCLTVGFENGTILFLDRNLVARGHTVQRSTRRVHCLAWHPESTTSDLTLSPLRNYLAVALDSSTITVYNLSNFIEHLSSSNEVSVIENESQSSDLYKVHEVVATLTGHIDKVVCLAWSSYFSGYLVSGSYDNTAQVWNVESQELIATYAEHCGPVLCCMWSPLHPDFVLTGSADFTVRVWKTTDQKVIMPEQMENTYKKSSSKRHKAKVQNKAVKTIETLAENCSVAHEYTVSTNTLAKNVVPAENTTKNIPLKETKKKKLERHAYFSRSIKAMNDKGLLLNSIASIAKNQINPTVVPNNEEDTSWDTSLPLFSKKANFTLLLADEKSVHAAEERHNTVTEMDMWCDDLKRNLENATKEKRLNDFLVSLAPSLSTKIWREVCEAYANQLTAEGNPQKAVSFLLCIHKPYKAIQILEDAHLYKEAYAIGRCKLDPEDPALENVLKNWARYNAESGQFEQAAYIYAIIGDFYEASKYLARRKDVAALTTAAEVALLTDDSELGVSLATRAIDEALASSDYRGAWSVIDKFPCLKYMGVHLSTHEEFRRVTAEKTGLGAVLAWLNGQSDYGLLQRLDERYRNYHSHYTQLLQNTYTFENEEMLWLKVSHEISMAVICGVQEQRFKHVVTALHVISQYETLHRNTNKHNLLMDVVIRLDIKGPTSGGSIYATSNYMSSISLRAYLCFALLNWLVADINIEDITEHVPLIELAGYLITDALNQRAVKHCTITNVINKLEARISPMLCTTSGQEASESAEKKSVNESEGAKEETGMETLLEELNLLKDEKKQFAKEQVYTPNPVVVYSKANELSCMLPNGSVKDKFSKIISEAWTNAIS